MAGTGGSGWTKIIQGIERDLLDRGELFGGLQCRLWMSDCIVVLFQNKPTDGPFGGLGRAPRGVGMVNGITNNTNKEVEEFFLSVTIYISRYDKEVRDTLRDTLHLGDR